MSRLNLRAGRTAKPSVDKGSGLPTGGWLAVQAKELEERSLSERTAIAVLRLRVDDHGLATEEECDDVASRIQGPLRAYDRLFRVGERDFTLLAPGADVSAARALALKVQNGVGAIPIWRGGTMQIICGASASLEGEAFVYELVSAKADQALEEAEAGGVAVVVGGVLEDRLRVVTPDDRESSSGDGVRERRRRLFR